MLYADPTSPNFGRYHNALRKASGQGILTYRLRYRRAKDSQDVPLPVNGYGVQLALKRTDYIVIDDRDAGESSSQKPLSADVDLDNDDESIADLKPLSTTELTSLGMKAASFILQNENPFETLVKLTQDFPKFSSSIAGHDTSEDFTAEHDVNRAQRIPCRL